jgi:GT2 family glycosyltransferase
MDLSVITVTWNAKNDITEQLSSVISGCRGISFEQIVIDNNSSDGTVELIKKSLPQVKIIENKENAGFGAANNQGVRISSGDFILFLNPDMKVEPGSLDKMVAWMKEHPEAGIASCKLVDGKGNYNPAARPRRFPKVWEMVALIFKIPHLFPQILDNYFMKDFNPGKEQTVPSVRGSFMLMRREVYQKLGWAFDPRYYIWFEDVDTCREVWRLGYQVVYTPVINCVDYIGQSFNKRDTVWKQKQFTSSMLIYFKKWEPWYKWMWIALFRPVGIGLAYVGDLFYRK